MDFKEAIRAHSDWKMKLSRYLENPDGSLQPRIVGIDNGCTLGQWLYGAGKRYESLPEFQHAKSLHSRFHSAAADIVSRANRGAAATAEAMLGSGSEYASTSTAVVAALMELEVKVRASRTRR